jgi:hypothetical protein
VNERKPLVGGTDGEYGTDAEAGVLVMPYGEHGTLQAGRHSLAKPLTLNP